MKQRYLYLSLSVAAGISLSLFAVRIVLYTGHNAKVERRQREQHMYRLEFDSLTSDQTTFQCYHTYKRFYEQCTRGGKMHFDEGCQLLSSGLELCKRDLATRLPTYTPSMLPVNL